MGIKIKEVEGIMVSYKSGGEIAHTSPSCACSLFQVNEQVQLKITKEISSF
jgi:hypothetical protein